MRPPVTLTTALSALLVTMTTGSVLHPQTSPTSTLTREGRQFLRTVTGQLPALPGGQLHIIVPGSVTLQGSANVQQVTWSLQTRADSAPIALSSSVTPQLQPSTRTLILAVGGDPHARYDLLVKVPRHYGAAIGVDSSLGNVAAYDLDGPLTIRAGGGNVQLDRINANVEAESWGGEVRLGQIGGSLRIRAGAGAIQLEHATGETWLETGGGDITVRRTDATLHAATGAGNIQADQITGNAELRTAGGKIELGQATGQVLAENAAGSIQIGRAAGLQCYTESGSLRLRETGAMRALTRTGSINAELPNGQPWRGGVLQTGEGDIIVSIPSKLSVTVVAQSRASLDARRRIISEFNDLKMQAPLGDLVRGQLLLNGGGPVLDVVALQGAVYLKRQQ